MVLYNIDLFQAKLSELMECKKRVGDLQFELERMLEDRFLGKIVGGKRYGYPIEGKVVAVRFPKQTLDISLRLVTKKRNGEYTKPAPCNPVIKLIDMTFCKDGGAS